MHTVRPSREEEEEEEERKEERNAACEEIATTESYYYKKAFVQQRSSENNSCIFCISHAMHGMRKIGIRRNAFGATHKWGKDTKRGENDFAHFVAFMEIMLEETNNYYDKMIKSYEKKVAMKREEQEQEQEEEEEEGVQEAFSSLKMS